MHTLESLASEQNSLAPHYSAFRVADRLLLSGHSHQAWPDVARSALLEAFDAAAEFVDGKWPEAFERAERVRTGFRRLLDDPDGEIALTTNTHEAVVRFLSALPLTEKPHLITTDAEFFTLRRQLARLEEAGVAVTRIAGRPAATLSERLLAALIAKQNQTSALLVSSVLFEGAEIVPQLPELARACVQSGVPLFIDAYHHLNVVPFSVKDSGFEAAFITGGGYKYCQLGEGNCFLRFPKHCELRPVITGWFADFADLDAPQSTGQNVRYGRGSDRFAGATYDPVSHYRGARVFQFFEEQGLDVKLLRAVSQHQIARLRARFDACAFDPALIDYDRALAIHDVAGFLALTTPCAASIVKGLQTRGVHCDARGNILRLGPAPYLSDAQLDRALDALAEVVRDRASRLPVT